MLALIVRVILNGVELTKSAATDQSGMARGEWLWDAVNKNLYFTIRPATTETRPMRATSSLRARRSTLRARQKICLTAPARRFHTNRD